MKQLRFNLNADVTTEFGDEFWKRRDSDTGVLTYVNLQSWNINRHSVLCSSRICKKTGGIIQDGATKDSNLSSSVKRRHCMYVYIVYSSTQSRQMLAIFENFHLEIEQ